VSSWDASTAGTITWIPQTIHHCDSFRTRNCADRTALARRNNSSSIIITLWQKAQHSTAVHWWECGCWHNVVPAHSTTYATLRICRQQVYTVFRRSTTAHYSTILDAQSCIRAGWNKARHRLQYASIRATWVAFGTARSTVDFSCRLKHRTVLIWSTISISTWIADIITFLLDTETIIIASTATIGKLFTLSTGRVVSPGGNGPTAWAWGNRLQTLTECWAVIRFHTPVTQLHCT
jgi:hypothetical protein